MDFRATIGAADEVGDSRESVGAGTDRTAARTGRDLPIAEGPWRRGPRRRPSPLEALEALKARAAEPAHLRVASERHDDMRVRLDAETGTYWAMMHPSGRPCFTPRLLGGLASTQRSFIRMFAEAPPQDEPPFRYLVVGSDHLGVFNLGGDLELFAERIRAGDREGLADYALSCIEVVYANYMDNGLPFVSIGLVQGDALGGGFEAALSCDVLVVERGAKCGFPEVLFNLFPGMGAFSILSRKLAAPQARAMIESGRLYEADELHALGLVDVVAEPGEGAAAVETYIARNRKRHNAHAAMYAAARRACPLSFEEMADIVDLWVDAAFGLGPSDLRKMERLVAAQDRRSALHAAE